MSRVRRQSHPPSLHPLPNNHGRNHGPSSRRCFVWTTPPAFRCRLLFRSEGPLNEEAGSSWTSINPLIKARFCKPGRRLIVDARSTRIGHPFRARNRARRRHSSAWRSSYYVSLRFNGPDLFIRPVHRPLPASWTSSSSNYKYFASLITVERGKIEGTDWNRRKVFVAIFF